MRFGVWDINHLKTKITLKYVMNIDWSILVKGKTGKFMCLDKLYRENKYVDMLCLFKYLASKWDFLV